MLFNGETGIIDSLTDNQVVIGFSAKDACDTCGLKIVCAPGKESQRSLTLSNPGNLTLGQAVKVEELSNLELHLALAQFGLPTLLFLLGLLLGYYLPLKAALPRELVGFLFSLVGLGMSYPLATQRIKTITKHIPEKYLRIIADV